MASPCSVGPASRCRIAAISGAVSPGAPLCGGPAWRVCQIRGGIFRPLFPDLLAPGDWRSAAGELKDLRRLVFMALMIAACIVLSHCSIRLGESLSLSVTFLARALCSLVCGPLAVIVFGAAEDTLSFFLSSGGYPYFPGYMLTTITGCMIYALFFYRAKITWRRIILAKLLTNIQNVLLGALWSAILYSKGYLYYLTQSAVKNALYLPLQILLLGFLFQAVLPVMQRQHWLPEQLPGGRLRW